MPVRASARVGTITVVVTPGHPANRFVPARALGAGVDGHEQGDIARIFTPANLKAMRSAGLKPLTYRLRTELGIEAWHWNPRGKWSEGAKKQGYWTSDSRPSAPISVCYGYRLPRRGSTVDQANNDGYSRLDDGDVQTFWKSNPYLDLHFTGEDNARHPQWVVLNLNRRRPVNAIRIRWTLPYATRYQVQYWAGDAGSDASDSPPDPESISDTFGDGAWRTFPSGTVRQGRGGDVTLRLCAAPRAVQYVRLWMTASSEHPPPGAADVRDGLGYAIRELYLGTVSQKKQFRDILRHTHSNTRQTVIFVSSTDPWHRASDRDPRTEQPGFDRVYHSGLTSGLPILTPVGLLYDTPENAAAEARYLQARGYPVSQIEMGEEPDGQEATPEDYGALYSQWADALHHVDPALKLGGPCFQTDVTGWTAWPDARGNSSWLNRFLRELRARGHLPDFNFFSFEWYPFDNVCADTAPQLAIEPTWLAHSLSRLRREGLPRDIPISITEYGYSAFAGQAEVDRAGALLNADIVGQFLTLGGSRAYLYGYEPNILMRESDACETWGNLTLFLADDSFRIQSPVAAYYGARLLTQRWAQPSGQSLEVYPAQSDIRNTRGQALVTAYALRRPDGRWSLLVINKDPKRAWAVRIRFRNTAAHTETPLRGPVDLYQLSDADYVWHPRGAHGYAAPDLPPTHTMLSNALISLPPYSLSVIRSRDDQK